MTRTPKLSFLILFLLMIAASGVAAEKPGTFSPYVDDKGNLSLPAEFRSTWVHLGTWVLTTTRATGPDPGPTAPHAGVQNVYTQPAGLTRYRRDGMWPDGAVIVMEVRAIKWDDLPTGHVIEEGGPLEWFVMIRDGKGRFPGNPHWGNGWGWALFRPADPRKNASGNYKDDCLGCHEVAKNSEWIFMQGYTGLK